MLPPAAGGEVEVTDEWERLELRCAISFQRLTDPAKGASCTHRSCCNFGDLTAYVSRQKECPIAGCSAPLARSRVQLRHTLQL